MNTPRSSISNSDETTLSLAGSLIFANVAALWRDAQVRLRGGCVTVLDLSAVDVADSAGLACVLALLAEGRTSQPTLHVRHAPESMRALAKVSDAEHWLS